jgi:hypothetical protein
MGAFSLHVATQEYIIPPFSRHGEEWLSIQQRSNLRLGLVLEELNELL